VQAPDFNFSADPADLTIEFDLHRIARMAVLCQTMSEAPA
jgi:hypothetical protein